MQQTDRVIAVTGAAGAIGRRLLLELEENGDQREVVALDTRPLAFPVHNVSAYRRDVAEPIGDILEGRRVTTVVHLAFDARRGRSQLEAAAIRQSNLDALKSVLDSCASAQVRHFILLSSHMAYGAYADNPVPLRDDAPLRASPDSPYGYDKLLSEELVREFDAQHEDIAVTILRPCPVLGPNTHHSVARGMFRPMLLAVRGWDPPLQFLYEDDLARVLSIVIAREIPGVFNVAGEGVVFYRELAERNQEQTRQPSRLPCLSAGPVDLEPGNPTGVHRCRVGPGALSDSSGRQQAAPDYRLPLPPHLVRNPDGLCQLQFVVQRP